MNIILNRKKLAKLKVETLPLKEAKLLASMLELILLRGEEKKLTLPYYPGNVSNYANMRFHDATIEELRTKIRKGIDFYCGINQLRGTRRIRQRTLRTVKDRERSRGTKPKD